MTTKTLNDRLDIHVNKQAKGEFDSQSSTTSPSLIHWLSTGWALFLKAPFKLMASMIMLMVIAGLFQIIEGPTGMLVSKWVGAMLAAALWPVLDQLSKSGRFNIKRLASYSGWKLLPLVAIVLLIPFFFQIGVASAILGDNGIPLMLFGQIGATTTLQVAYIFASAAPIGVLLTFIPAYLLLDNTTPVDSILKGVNMVFKAWKPMLGLIFINAAVLFLAPFTIALSAVLIGPVLICVNYCAYQTLRQA